MTGRPRRTTLALGLLVLLAVPACGGHPGSARTARSQSQAPAEGQAPASPGPAGQAGSSLQAASVLAPSDGGPGPSASAPAPAAGQAAALAGAASFVPLRLRLPSGRTVPVLPAATRDDGSLAVPDDPATVGWWRGGSQPGDPYGSTVLAGHIDSRAYGIGALAELVTAHRGDAITVRNGGASRTYRITSISRVAKADLVPGTDAFDRTGPPRLVLITCGGRFDPATHHYADNVIITAAPVAGRGP